MHACVNACVAVSASDDDDDDDDAAASCVGACMCACVRARVARRRTDRIRFPGRGSLGETGPPSQTIRYDTIQHNTMQSNTTQDSTTHYYVIQYYTKCPRTALKINRYPGRFGRLSAVREHSNKSTTCRRQQNRTFRKTLGDHFLSLSLSPSLFLLLPLSLSLAPSLTLSPCLSLSLSLPLHQKKI